MTPQRRKLLLYIAYPAFFLVSFVLFSYWMFPWDRVRDYVIQEVERPMGPGDRRRPSGVELEIEELSPSWLTGVELEGVKVRKAPEPGQEGDPLEIEIAEATARVSLLSLLGGSIDVSYDLEVGGGTIEGEFADSEEQTTIAAVFEEVDLQKLGILSAAIGLPARGKIDGEVDLQLSNEAEQTTGSVDLTISGLQIGDGRAKLVIGDMRDGVTIERIDVGDVRLAIDVESGNGRVREFSANGDDLELQGGGTIRMLRPLDTSRLDLLIRFKFSDGYKNRNDRTRALFSLMDFTPQLRPAKTPDGALQYRVTGSAATRIGTTPAGRARPPGED